MIVFMRHGERGDNQWPQISSQIPYDPPITTMATETAKKSTQSILKFFEEHQIKKYHIVSSPFLRCMMTAQLVAKNLKKYSSAVEVGDRQIEYAISEYLRADWFKQYYPLNSLVLNLEQQSKGILGKYLAEPGKWRKRQYEHLEKDFPENYGLFSKRIGKFRNTLKYPQKGEAVLYFTHGFVVREICWRMNQVPDYRDEIKYCGYAIYKHDGKKDVLIKANL